MKSILKRIRAAIRNMQAAADNASCEVQELFLLAIISEV